MTKSLILNSAELAFAKGPFAYEYIAARDSGKWRIHDSKDNAVGSAESEAEAVDAVRDLNGRQNKTKTPNNSDNDASRLAKALQSQFLAS